MTECIFCKTEEFNGRLVLKTDYFNVILTNIPIVSGHLLVVPQRHLQRYDELSNKELADLSEIISKVKKLLQKTFKASGFNFAFNEGIDAGQSVPHFHMHILPRKPGDAGILEYEPRKFLYRPGSREVLPEAELKAVANLLKENL